MNKAFTREPEASVDDDGDEVGAPALPAGARNYITPQGYARLRAELRELIDAERPRTVEVVAWAASNGDRSENGDYFYGATVTYANARGEERTITIKGIGETDNLHGEVSWISPLARALIRAREGDEVRLHTQIGRAHV